MSVHKASFAHSNIRILWFADETGTSNTMSDIDLWS